MGTAKRSTHYSQNNFNLSPAQVKWAYGRGGANRNVRLRLAGGPRGVGVEQRDRRQAHFRARVFDLAAVGDIDQCVGGLVVDPAHRDRLEEQAHPLGEDLLALGTGDDLADHDRPGLLTGDAAVRGVLEPIPLGQTIDDAAIEMHEVTGDAADLRVGNRLDDDTVAGPVVAEPADLVRSRYPGGQAEKQDQG